MKTKSPTVRWMRLEDLNQIDKICSLSKDFIKNFLNQPTAICSVVAFENNIIGFILYKISKSKIYLHHIAVDPNFRNQKIASSLISNLVNKLNKSRNTIKAEISEYDLDAQIFFKKMGFKAVKIQKSIDGDTYIFKYSSSI